MYSKLTIKDVDIRKKRVLIRVDFNVPLDEKGRVADITKIKATLPTINYALENKAKIILISHLGRPKGKIEKSLSLTQVAESLASLLNKKVEKLSDCVGSMVKKKILAMKEGDIVLLENLRFHIDEEKNDTRFAKELASLGEVYVNDAFGASHRKHASVDAITKFIKPAVAGLLLNKEIEVLDKILNHPQKPFLALLGGMKISDKIPVVRNLLDKVDMIALGGAMSYTFLKAIGVDVGASLVEEDKIEIAKDILLESIKYDVEMYLPRDHVIAEFISPDSQIKSTDSKYIPNGWKGVDIGPKTIENIKSLINKAKTIIWNGPMGVIEIDRFAEGTKALAEAISNCKADVVIGGGDSALFAHKFGLENKIMHISTGGGACLEYLSGRELPGIVSLADKTKKRSQNI
jgi:3-phosphoglycerate kinase